MGTNPLGAEELVTVAVVDDHQVVLDGIRAWIHQDQPARIHVLADGGQIDSVLAGPGGRADVLILDLGLFGGSVADRVAELAERHRVVVFSAERSDETIRAVLAAGAVAYLTKDEGKEHFIGTVLAAAEDRAYVTPSVARAMLGDTSPHRPRLSDQERRALLLWFQLPKKQAVATQMGISVETVDQYIGRARAKYLDSGRQAGNKAAMVARAIEDGLIRPEDVR
ncbi:DNA-binding response regulator [Rhizocola hellebori]|uniref:DNA-binding response regulator n=1 Tax=Rhizocola hellebori TaxID=1392758 RepID=A0A8J3VD17_9ACTN|nr:response regulator transcription factor [Rhizocola hellebori]GIH02275.1 DNA-binding response regulator [Rhizocola hellebori]